MQCPPKCTCAKIGCNTYRNSADDQRILPVRIGIPQRIVHRIAIRARPAREADRIGLDIPPRGRIIIAVAVVIEVGEGFALAREGGRGVAGGLSDGRACRVGYEDRRAEMVTVHPAERAACGHHRQRHVSADAVIAAERAAVPHLRVQPDELGLHIRGAGAIFAQHPAIGRIDKAATKNRLRSEL
jgi:hypothetical protein